MAKKIDNYTFISTKNGDRGTSRNYSNDTVPKIDILFDTLGSIDELSSMLGVAYHVSSYKPEIKEIQLDLQHIMSVIATRADDSRYHKLVHITAEDIERLEGWEQRILKECHIEPRFVLPGSESTQEGAYLDVCRSLTRRCERTVLKYIDRYDRVDLDTVKQYLNRLSDLLFIMARSKDDEKK
jgi:cob(I)alamin adenosyltransferase